MKRGKSGRKYRIPSTARWIAREVLRGSGPLRGALRVLNALKRKGLMKEFAIGGGMGAMRYTEPFATLDLAGTSLGDRRSDRSGEGPGTRGHAA